MNGKSNSSVHSCDKSVFKSLKRQTVKEVLDFSSQYGSDQSRSYTVHNIVGETNNYPHYGDFTQTLVFRTYGTWWDQCPSTPKPFKKYTNFSFISQDFVDVQFNDAVYPTEIEIFETYNPGAVVRILAFNNKETTVTTENSIYDSWFVLWSGNVQRCKRQAHVFSPKLKKCPFKTSRLRFEFNQSHCDYYTEIDAVVLHGLDSKEEYTCVNTEYSVDCLNKGFKKQITIEDARDEIANVEQGSCNIMMLPTEVINKIFSYLTFTDFGSLSRSCRSFRDCCYDPLCFKEFDLQPYWQKVNKFSLQYLTERCRSTEKLRLSWCGSTDMLSSFDFSSFLQKICGRLRCLYLSCCRFVDQSALILIANVCPKLEELDLSSCIDIPSEALEEISKLPSLKRLNLYRTQITKSSFEKIARYIEFTQSHPPEEVIADSYGKCEPGFSDFDVRSCTQLMHINLGGCFKCTNFNKAMEFLKHCPNVVSLDLWRAKSLTPEGITSISQNCPNLEEIDIGWCNSVSIHGCLRLLVTHCPSLKKIFLTALRTVSDDDLIAISEHCSFLEQLDVLGNSNISKKAAEMVLNQCQHLAFFDVSFCSDLDDEWYRTAKERYPHVELKKSFQHAQTS